MTSAAHHSPQPPAAPVVVQSPQDGALADLRQRIDRSCHGPCLAFFGSAVAWLLLGTLAGLVSSLKLHTPGFLAGINELTFGRVRPVHLDIVAFGWSSMAGVGVMLWLMCRLCRVPLRFPGVLILAAVIWNIGVAVGCGAVLLGQGTSVEWLEFPTYAAFILFIAFAIIAIWAVYTFGVRQPGHVYVSQWYLFGALFWFPWLYATVQLLILMFPVKGVTQETIHWWFGHNVLGIWFTPIGLAAIYYLIPKVIGRPIHSYYLSILGFWSLALFYNWAGAHHLIAGPIPAWLITVSIVGSMMMFIPVTTVAVNHHMTTRGHFGLLRYSPTLRFIVFGAMSYTVVSVQGSLMALRFFNEPFHFTHHTISHAHLGLYAFYTMVMFGAMYYILPRLTGREWASARLMRTHFWCTAGGILLMFGCLTVGGMIQGFEMNQASDSLWTLIRDKGLMDGVTAFFQGFSTQNGGVPFMDIVRGTIPWLWVRSAAGVLILVGHVAFAVLVGMNLLGLGPVRDGPTLFRQDEAGYRRASRGPVVTNN